MGNSKVQYSRVYCTLTVQLSSQRTSLKFFPRLELLLWKHTLTILERNTLSLETIGDISEDSGWMVEDMLLQYSISVSPDITARSATAQGETVHGRHARAHVSLSASSLSGTSTHDSGERHDNRNTIRSLDVTITDMSEHYSTCLATPLYSPVLHKLLESAHKTQCQLKQEQRMPEPIHVNF